MKRGRGRPRAPRAAQVTVAMLALASLAWTVVAATTPAVPDKRDAVGRFGPAHAPRTRTLLRRLGRGLIACQEPDGGFRAGVDGDDHNDDAQRVAASALATAALAQLRDLGVAVPGRDEALARARQFLVAHQTPRGAVLGTPPGSTRSQVLATCGAAWAWLVAPDAAHDRRLREAAAALRRHGRDGFENGYVRALAAMFAERIARDGREDDVLDGQPRDLVRWRAQDVLPDEPGWELWDVSLAEAISRSVLGLWARTPGVVDPFPARILEAVLREPPDWSGASSDVQGWWMQAWLVARGGQGRGAAWFLALLDVLTEWTDEESDLVPGGFYASALVHTACGVMALAEGLLAAPASR